MVADECPFGISASVNGYRTMLSPGSGAGVAHTSGPRPSGAGARRRLTCAFQHVTKNRGIVALFVLGREQEREFALMTELKIGRASCRERAPAPARERAVEAVPQQYA